jgi:photosystem II stability/assembly factor-like uncharacterized protein
MKQFQIIFLMILLTPCMLSAQWSMQTSGTTKDLFDVAFCNANTGIAVGEAGTMLKTTTKGVIWTQLPSLTPGYLLTIYFVNENTGWTAGESGFIYKTTNKGESWVSQNSPELFDITSIYFLNANTGVAVGELGYIMKTIDGGSNWTKQNREYGAHLNGVFLIDENAGWAAGSYGDKYPTTILKSTDGGEAWFNQTSGLNAIVLIGVHFADANTGTIVGTRGTILKTTNGGNIWTSQSSGTIANLNEVDFINSNTGIAIGNSGMIIKTTNGGENWIQQVIVTSQPLLGMSFVDDGFNLGWTVGLNGTILRYTGTIPSVPGNLEVSAIDIGKVRLSWEDTSDNESGFVLQRRDVVNTNWIVVDTIPKNTTQYIDSSLAVPREYFWRMFSYNVIGKSAYSDTASLITSNIEPSTNIVPNKYELYQNYPNPFNPATNISFDIPNSGFVKLTIYDMLGKEVVHLVNEVLQPGKYDLNWNAGMLSSGIYFYKLETGNFTDIKKLMLIK